jgi:hypothetical protein
MEQPIKNCLKALQVMAESEQTVAEFYTLCSEFYSENYSFWAGLAREEQVHARVINRLIELVNIQPHEFSAGKLTPLDAVKSFIKRTQSNIETLKKGGVPRGQSFTHGLPD